MILYVLELVEKLLPASILIYKKYREEEKKPPAIVKNLKVRKVLYLICYLSLFLCIFFAKISPYRPVYLVWDEVDYITHTR